MTKLVKVIGVGYILMGVLVAVYPEWFLSVDWASRSGLFMAAGLRVVVGLVLILAASASRFPTVFRVVGGIALLAGLMLPFIPIDLWAGLMTWWMVDNVALLRVTMGIGATLGGGFIAWAAEPKRSDA